MSRDEWTAFFAGCIVIGGVIGMCVVVWLITIRVIDTILELIP